jgi:hypothetical protein
VECVHEAGRDRGQCNVGGEEGGGAADAAVEKAALTSSSAAAAEASMALPGCWLCCTAATRTQRAREHGV